MIKFVLTLDELSRIIHNPEVDYWYKAMAKVLPANNINTKNRVAGFIAQCAVESSDFNVREENLNYTKSALLRVFKRYFIDRDPDDYVRNPEKLANYVYQDEYRTARGALGNVNPGDGWKFRGRGLKQLTGRYNYQKFGNEQGLTAEETIDFIETKEGALSSAVWFWNNANCNHFADNKDIEGLSLAINGGRIGLSLRKRKWNKALDIIDESCTYDLDDPIANEVVIDKPTRILRLGCKGEDVYSLQIKLGMTPSSKNEAVFDRRTYQKVKQFQEENDLAIDGIAGPKTLAVLFN